MKKFLISFCVVVGILSTLSEINCFGQAKNKSRSAIEDDIREAVFRYQFLHNASGQQQHAKVYFLSLSEGKDPNDKFVERFRGQTPPVKKGSQATTQPGVVKDKTTGEEGIIFRVTRIKWINGSDVVVEGGYYEGNLSSSGNIYRVKLTRKRWVVKSDRMLYIS